MLRACWHRLLHRLLRLSSYSTNVHSSHRPTLVCKFKKTFSSLDHDSACSFFVNYFISVQNWSQGPSKTLLSVGDQNRDQESHENPIISAPWSFGLTSFADAQSRKSNLCAQRNIVLCFLTRLGKGSNGYILDSGKLPTEMFQKCEMFSWFIDEFNLLYLSRDPS